MDFSSFILFLNEDGKHEKRGQLRLDGISSGIVSGQYGSRLR